MRIVLTMTFRLSGVLSTGLRLCDAYQGRLGKEENGSKKWKGEACFLISSMMVTYDMREEMEKEIRDEEQRGRGWGRFGV